MLFYRHTLRKICDEAIVKDPTTFETRRAKITPTKHVDGKVRAHGRVTDTRLQQDQLQIHIFIF